MYNIIKKCQNDRFFISKTIYLIIKTGIRTDLLSEFIPGLFRENCSIHSMAAHPSAVEFPQTPLRGSVR